MARSRVLWTVAAVLFGTVALVAARNDESGEDKSVEKEAGVEVGLTGDFFSKYVWRGQLIVNNWVFQPGLSVGYEGLTASIWNNMNLDDQKAGGVPVGAGSLTETDLALDYSNKVPGVDVLGFSVGAIYYSFLNTQSHPTAEAYGGLNLAVPAEPAIRWYYDFVEADGSYAQVSLGHTIEKLREWRKDCYCGLQTGVSLGMGTNRYNAFYFGLDRTALNDLTLTAGLPICLGKVTIKPTLGYSTLVDKDIRRSNAENNGVKNDNLWGGVALIYNF